MCSLMEIEVPGLIPGANIFLSSHPVLSDTYFGRWAFVLSSLSSFSFSIFDILYRLIVSHFILPSNFISVELVCKLHKVFLSLFSILLLLDPNCQIETGTLYFQ